MVGARHHTKHHLPSSSILKQDKILSRAPLKNQFVPAFWLGFSFRVIYLGTVSTLHPDWNRESIGAFPTDTIGCVATF